MKEGYGAKKLGESLAKGQPEWMQIVATIAHDEMKEVI
jgi:hypothetical protein